MTGLIDLAAKAGQHVNRMQPHNQVRSIARDPVGSVKQVANIGKDIVDQLLVSGPRNAIDAINVYTDPTC